ncbi:hypothetical protein DSLASN_00370 [Desulfoluna limicola]|uniref:Uncharacterized protein n=1 Tax=Desulfoluna limicola TaxID=2810562 RepID=A0ABN6EYW0_9BACT|nr:hypothetical protein DSLASN_00370 [Desulfoluna limicola]
MVTACPVFSLKRISNRRSLLGMVVVIELFGAEWKVHRIAGEPMDQGVPPCWVLCIPIKYPIIEG